MKLQYKLEDKVDIDGTVYEVNASFGVILRLFDLLEDVSIGQVERIEIGLSMLIRDKLSDDYNPEAKAEILKMILEDYVKMEKREVYDILGNPMPATSDNERLLDYEEDAAFIYAAFMQVYRIDLIDEQNNLHWHKFQAMLNGLPDGTKLGQIIGYRSWNESDESKDYKQFMREQKQYWQLGGDIDD